MGCALADHYHSSIKYPLPCPALLSSSSEPWPTPVRIRTSGCCKLCRCLFCVCMQGRNSRNKATRSPEALALVASWLEETSHLSRPPVEDFLRDDDTLRSLRNVSGFLSEESNPARGSNGRLATASRDLHEGSLPNQEATAPGVSTQTTTASSPSYRPQPGTWIEVVR